MKRFAIVLCLFAILLTSGCAATRNRWAANGSIITTTRGNYIVISQSGGRIMDCWVLRNAFVQSEKDSDGWLFIDNDGNPTNVGGDAKIIRVEDSRLLDQYHEYHMELETQTYHQKFRYLKVCGRYHLRGRTKSFFGRVA